MTLCPSLGLAFTPQWWLVDGTKECALNRGGETLVQWRRTKVMTSPRTQAAATLAVTVSTSAHRRHSRGGDIRPITDTRSRCFFLPSTQSGWLRWKACRKVAYQTKHCAKTHSRKCAKTSALTRDDNVLRRRNAISQPWPSASQIKAQREVMRTRSFQALLFRNAINPKQLCCIPLCVVCSVVGSTGADLG